MAEEFNIKVGDTSPAIRYQVSLADGQTLVGASVRLKMKGVNEADLKVDSEVTVDSAENVLSYQWMAADTDTAGIYFAEFEVTYADNNIETFPNGPEYIRVNVNQDLG